MASFAAILNLSMLWDRVTILRMSAAIKFDDSEPIGVTIVDRRPGIVRGGETRAEEISFTCVNSIDRLVPALIRDEQGRIYDFRPIGCGGTLGNLRYSGYITPAKPNNDLKTETIGT